MSFQRIHRLPPLSPQVPRIIQNDTPRRHAARCSDSIDPNDLATFDVILRPPAVVPRRLLVSIVPEPVPLAAALRVDVQIVVVYRAPGAVGMLFIVQSPGEGGPVEGGEGGQVEGPVQGDALAELDLLGRSLHRRGRQQVQRAELVFGPVETPCIACRPRLEGKGGEGRPCHGWVDRLSFFRQWLDGDNGLFPWFPGLIVCDESAHMMWMDVGFDDAPRGVFKAGSTILFGTDSA